MKKVALVFLLLLPLVGWATDNEAVRQLFLESAADEDRLPELYKLLKAAPDIQSQSVLQGYLGTVEAMMARKTWNPFKKYRYFNDGKAKLEAAIQRDKDNPELRFLRFLVQYNSPDFLDYNENMEEDIQTIVDNLSYCKNTPGYRTLLRKAYPSLLDKCDCSPQEQEKLRAALQ